MEPNSSTPEQPFLEQLRRRRAELLESMSAVEQALAAPAPGRQERWAERVHVALAELSADFDVHIAITESPDGLYRELLTTELPLEPWRVPYAATGRSMAIFS